MPLLLNSPARPLFVSTWGGGSRVICVALLFWTYMSHSRSEEPNVTYGEPFGGVVI